MSQKLIDVSIWVSLALALVLAMMGVALESLTLAVPALVFIIVLTILALAGEKKA